MPNSLVFSSLASPNRGGQLYHSAENAEALLLTERDVLDLLGSKSETKSLDYKQSMNWATATTAEKAALIKDVLAMANSQDGGRIIFGVRDVDFEPTGLSSEDFQSFDVTPFTDFLSRYADPSFHCGVHKFVIGGTRFVAIEVPEFDTIPIICKADANDTNNRRVLQRGALYIRTNRAASEIVPDAETMRDLINRAMTKRGDEFLRTFERLMKGKPIRIDEQSAAEIKEEIAAADDFVRVSLPEEFKQAGHWEVDFCVVPYLRERVPSLAVVSQLVNTSQITLRGWSFPYFDRQHTSAFARGVQSYMERSASGHLEGYRAYQSGVFVWRSTYWEDTVASMRTGEKALSFVGVILDITEHFLFARRYYEKLAPDGTVKLTIRLTDTQNRALKSFSEFREGTLLGDYICRVPELEILTDCTVAELIASYDERARTAVRRVYEQFNWNNSDEDMIKAWQDRLLNRRL